MIGAIAGDIVGSRFEHAKYKSVEFELWHPACRFTDDTVMMIATADALLGDRDFGAAYHRWGNRYPYAGYGKRFRQWLASEAPTPYGSWGNGSAMRVCPVAWVARSEAEVLELARLTALPTHGHERAIIGAQAVALATWLAGMGADNAEIRSKVAALSGYNLGRSVDEIRPGYTFDVSCDGSVPEALICALEADSWEAAVRLAVSLGGDADTQAAIAGAFWEARDMPDHVVSSTKSYLGPEVIAVLERFDGTRRVPRTIAPPPRNAESMVDEIVTTILDRGDTTRREICEAFGLSDDDYASIRPQIATRHGMRALQGKTGGFGVDRRIGTRSGEDRPIPLSDVQRAAADRLVDVLPPKTLVSLAEEHSARELADEGRSVQITPGRAAEILILQHDHDLFSEKAIRAAVGKALQVTVPGKWAPGKSAALRFVADVGFPPGFAGIASREKPPAVELIEPYGEMPPLWRFQRELKDQIRQMLNERSAKAIASLPTGAGKTRTAVEALIEWLIDGGRQPGTAVIWMAHSAELCEQACGAFQQVWRDSQADTPLCIIRRYGGAVPTAEELDEARSLPTIIVTTSQALDGVAAALTTAAQPAPAAEAEAIRSPRSQSQSDMAGQRHASTDSLTFFETIGSRTGALVIDEAHRAAAPGYRAVIDWAGTLPLEPSILGLTATPFRGPGAEHEGSVQLRALFQNRLLLPVELGNNPRKTLQDAGVLAIPIVRDIRTGIHIPVMPEERGYDDAMKILTDRRARRGVIVERIAEIAAADPEASILYFGPSVKDAYGVALQLRVRGITAQGLSGATHRETRRMLINDFRQRRLTVLCNCDLLTTGFDSPLVTHVVVGRPTVSQVLYEQMVGRGLRGEQFGGTKHCHILDILDGLPPGIKPKLGYEGFREHWQIQALSLAAAVGQ